MTESRLIQAEQKEIWQAVVEASDEGCGLYAKEGFEVAIENYVVPLSDRFKERRTQRFIWMIRKPGSNKT